MHPLLTALAAVVMLSPPSGRPPVGALERYEPRLYDLKFEVAMTSSVPLGQDDPRAQRHVARDPKKPRPFPDRNERRLDFGGTIDVTDAPIVMPLILQGTFSRIDHSSIGAQLFLGTTEVDDLRQHFHIDDGLPQHTHLAVLPIARFVGQDIRWNITYRVKTYSSRIDDAAAARIAWPREFPDEVKDGLAPQMFIESDEPIFAETVARVSGGNLRMVPPYLAAKDLVRYAIKELQVTGPAVFRGRMNVLHGLYVDGALTAAVNGQGNPNDLVCVCVALLRAAGIPARPVIGVEEDDRNRKTFVTWAEFYLPEAGWIPFDPIAMRGKAIRNRDVRTPWPEFGSLKDLNRRIPLSYHFMPPRAVESPMAPAVWGWDPRPNGAPNMEQRITIGTTSRGRAPEDEQ